MSDQGEPRLLFVRHAKVAVAGVCYGQWDVPVEMDGPRAAARLVPQLEALGVAVAGSAGSPLARIWTSPWARTRPVAEALALDVAPCAPPVVVDPRLSETSMGEWEGVPFARLEAEDGARFGRWMEAWRTEGPPGGEAPATFVRRVAAWLDDARARPGLALVVAHAGVLRAVRALAKADGAAGRAHGEARLEEATAGIEEAMAFPVENLRVYTLDELRG